MPVYLHYQLTKPKGANFKTVKYIVNKLNEGSNMAAKCEASATLNRLEAGFFAAAKACHVADRRNVEAPSAENNRLFLAAYHALNGWEAAMAVAGWGKSEISAILGRAYEAANPSRAMSAHKSKI